MKTPREKYLNDNHYKSLVDMMRSFIEECKYTPSEMREAAILASILYEEHRLPKYVFAPKDIAKSLRLLHDWTEIQNELD